MTDARQRLAKMRDLLTETALDAVIVMHDDEYLSAELTPDKERLRYLCGFTGSAGCAVIVKGLPEGMPAGGHTAAGEEFTVTRPAALFVDGRYLTQAREQLDPDWYEILDLGAIRPEEWLAAALGKKSRVGIDLKCLSYREYLQIRDTLADADIELFGTEENLVDVLWEERPPAPVTPAEIFPDEYNGSPSPQKRHYLAAELRRRGLDATIIGDPESICWLLNIRGHDRRYLPVVNCRLIAYSNEALEWYISAEHLQGADLNALEAHFGHIDIFPEERFPEVLARFITASVVVYVDPDSVNAKILNELYEGGAQVEEGLGLCQLPKAVKNDREIAGEYTAHLKDGVAMCRFLAWLDDVTGGEKNWDEETYARQTAELDEAVLAARAEGFRKAEAGYRGPSFATISAVGPNAAMCHYNHADAAAPRPLGRDGLYLIDSGAHFDEGTTDITRTVRIGPRLDDEILRMYTLVLKAHIALATAIFPPGTGGLQLDALARRPLWDCGCDYAHGTGHGVGHVLGVHEGPQVISAHRSTVPLQAGMVVSNEPGYYAAGSYGIRLENLMVVQPCQQPGLRHMLCFQPLTTVPFDTRLTVRALLSPKEREWLNAYHHNVRNLIASATGTLTDTELHWLTRATAPL